MYFAVWLVQKIWTVTTMSPSCECVYFLSQIQTVCEKSVRRGKHARCEKHARHDMCLWVISCCLRCFMRQISHVSHLELSRGRSRNYTRDKGILLCDKEQNLISQFLCYLVCTFFLTSFSHLACFSHLMDFWGIVCSNTNEPSYSKNSMICGGGTFCNKQRTSLSTTKEFF